MSLSQDIKEYALDIGYSRVGITTAESFQDHMAEVGSRGTIYDFYTADPRNFLAGAEPQKIMPAAKSIICLVWDYAQQAFPSSLLGIVGRIYQARCYNAPPHRINGARMRLMADFLEKAGCRLGRGFFVPERRAAARAGVTTFGKNNFAYAKNSGSFILLSSFVVDRELEYDPPSLRVKCPPDCTACLEACPTGAIYEPLKLDPRRCISFNCWWTQDGRPHASSHIPHHIREKMGTKVHGCDLCQEACPRNAAKLRASYPEDPFLVKLAGEFSLAKMLEMPERFYETRLQPIMYNYINDKRYLQRNAAIALGNQGDRENVPVLARALEQQPDPLVREYVAWALGKIGGRPARAALEARLPQESDGRVLEELKTALAN